MSGAWDAAHVANALKQLFESRYKLHPKYIAAIKYYSPLIQIDLKQHDSGKSNCDVDTADVACYFEKDIKDDSIFHSNSTLTVSINGDALDIERIYYMDEKPSLFSLNQEAGEVIAVVIVVVLAAGLGITVLVILRLWCTITER